MYSKNVVKMAQSCRVTVLKTHILIPHRAHSNCTMKVLFYQILSSSKYLSDNDVNGLEYNSHATTLIKFPVLLRHFVACEDRKL